MESRTQDSITLNLILQKMVDLEVRTLEFQSGHADYSPTVNPGRGLGIPLQGKRTSSQTLGHSSAIPSSP